MKTFVTVFALVVASAEGFMVAPAATKVGLRATPGEDMEIDFDAPTERALAVGNVVASRPKKIFGVKIPTFLARAFDSNSENDNSHIGLMDLDEECYLGKNNDLDECADFDPPHRP